MSEVAADDMTQSARSISIKAIAIGSAIDIGGSILGGVLYIVVYFMLLASQGVEPEEMQRRALTDPTYYVVSVTLGLAFMTLGAYVAGRVAGRRELAHGLWIALIAIVVSVLLVRAADIIHYPAWYLPASFGLTIPAALLGGYLARRRARAPVPAGAPERGL